MNNAEKIEMYLNEMAKSDPWQFASILYTFVARVGNDDVSYQMSKPWKYFAEMAYELCVDDPDWAKDLGLFVHYDCEECFALITEEEQEHYEDCPLVAENVSAQWHNEITTNQ